MEYVKIPNIYKREEHGKNRLIMGEYSTEELCALENCRWVWTEKVDGTNVRIIWDGYRVEFRGRTDKAELPKDLRSRLEELFGGESKEELFEQTFGNKNVILYGEGFGGKIQGKNGYGDVDFILFDVMVENIFLERQNIESIAATFGIRVVPIVGTGTLRDAVSFVKDIPRSYLRDGDAEGIVCRPIVELRSRRGDRIIVKIKCRDFREAN